MGQSFDHLTRSPKPVRMAQSASPQLEIWLLISQTPRDCSISLPLQSVVSCALPYFLLRDQFLKSISNHNICTSSPKWLACFVELASLLPPLQSCRFRLHFSPGCNNAKTYVRTRLAGRTPVDFRTFFSKPEGGELPEDALDLLQRMLVFNPKKRITVQDALQHRYLRDTNQWFETNHQDLATPPQHVNVDMPPDRDDVASLKRMILEVCVLGTTVALGICVVA